MALRRRPTVCSRCSNPSARAIARFACATAQAEADFPLGAGWRVRPDDSLLESLRDWLAPDSVEVIYP